MAWIVREMLAYEANFKGEVRHPAWLWLARTVFPGAGAPRPRLSLPGTCGAVFSFEVGNFERHTGCGRPVASRAGVEGSKADCGRSARCLPAPDPSPADHLSSRECSLRCNRCFFAALDRVCARAHRNSRLCRCAGGGGVRAHFSALVLECVFLSMRARMISARMISGAPKRRPHAGPGGKKSWYH